MRIVRNTPEEFVMREAPWLLAGAHGAFTLACFGVLLKQHAQMSIAGVVGLGLLTAICAGMGLGLARWTRVVLLRPAGRIEIETLAAIGGRRIALALADLVEARADILHDADGDTSRVMLVFRNAAAAGNSPADCARIDRLRRFGLRRAGPAEIPLTVYFTGGDKARRIADAANAWAQGRAGG